MFSNYSNELSLPVLYNILNKLHLTVNKMYIEFDNCVEFDYLIYKLKELKNYLYDLAIELKFMDCENSIALIDFKAELLRVEEELMYLKILKI